METCKMNVGEYIEFSHKEAFNSTQVVILSAGKYKTEAYNPIAISNDGREYGGGIKEDVMILTKDTEVFITIPNWQSVVDDYRQSEYKEFKDGYARITRL